MIIDINHTNIKDIYHLWSGSADYSLRAITIFEGSSYILGDMSSAPSPAFSEPSTILSLTSIDLRFGGFTSGRTSLGWRGAALLTSWCFFSSAWANQWAKYIPNTRQMPQTTWIWMVKTEQSIINGPGHKHPIPHPSPNTKAPNISFQSMWFPGGLNSYFPKIGFFLNKTEFTGRESYN